MRTRMLRRPIVFLRVRCSILFLLITTVRCSVPHYILSPLTLTDLRLELLPTHKPPEKKVRCDVKLPNASVAWCLVNSRV
jgi:hypothetical protein